MRRAEVRPLAQVRLAEYDGTGGTEAFDDVRIARSSRTLECERAGRGSHAIGGIDVVLYEHRDAMHRTAHLTRLPLGVERIGDCECIRVGLEYVTECRSRSIECGDALEILLRDAV